VAINAVALISWIFFPYILQAQKKFKKSVVVELSAYLSKTTLTYVLYLLGALNLYWAFALHVPIHLIGFFVGLFFVGSSFFKAKPTKTTYKNLMKFSGWIGVNRVISAISGRLDIQMLAALAGAAVTGLYSIPSKLASFIVVLAASYSSVLAPRFARFNDKEKEKTYLKKATLGVLPFIGGVIVWIIIAKPFILLLFGEKYLNSVPVFRMLATALIPYLLTAPSVTAIIYAMKKTVYIGAFSFFQIASIFILNFLLIPKYGALGPTITFAVVYTVLAIYTWTIVIRYYWIKK
jgi:O-antigen/teichoic acid export membrane protein